MYSLQTFPQYITLTFFFHLDSLNTTGHWAWLGGNYTLYNSIDRPGIRLESSTWTSSDGTLYLFGGNGYGGGFLNDLWSFNVSSGNWTWIGGTSVNQGGVYFGDDAWPGGRSYAATWSINGVIYLFGGYGCDVASMLCILLFNTLTCHHRLPCNVE